MGDSLKHYHGCSQALLRPRKPDSVQFCRPQHIEEGIMVDGTPYWSGYILDFSSYGQSPIDEDTALQQQPSGTNS